MIEIAVGVDSFTDGRQYMHGLIKEMKGKGLWIEGFYWDKCILETKYIRIRFFPYNVYGPEYFNGKLFDAVFGYINYTHQRINHRSSHKNIKNLKLIDYIVEKENELNETYNCTERNYTN